MLQQAAAERYRGRRLLRMQRDHRARAHTCSISIIPLDDIIAIAVPVHYSLHAHIARIYGSAAKP